MLDPVRPVPYLAAAVDRVGQNADAAPQVAANGRHDPRAAAWRRDLVRVEPMSDRPRRLTAQVFGEDASDHARLGGFDLALADAGLAVAVREPTGAGASQGPTGKPAVGLVREVGQ